MDGQNIRFGLNAVKNVGRNLIAAVVRERKGKPFRSLYDFCKRMYGNEINRRAVESLIKCGAFDGMGSTRKALLQSIEGILKSVETDQRKNLDGQLDLFSQLNQTKDMDDYHIPEVAEFPTIELLQMEKEVSGLYLSGHPLDAYRGIIKNISSCKISELTGDDAKAYDNKVVKIVCAVIKSKFMTTRSNTMMAFTNVEDLSGTMEILVFPKVLMNCRDALQENAVVVITGRVSVKEDEAAKLLAENIVPIEQYNATAPAQIPEPAPKKPAKKGLYLKVPSQTCTEFHKVTNLLTIFEGDFPVYVYFEDRKQLTLAPKNLWTLNSDRLCSELKRILGERNVVVK